MKKTILFILVLCLLLCGCASKPFTGLSSGRQTEPSTGSEKNADEVRITLKGDSAEVRGGGAKAEGNVVTVSTVGTYRVSGTLNNGQLVVDTGEDAVNVTLILDGAEIRNESGPALWIKQAKNVHLQIDNDSLLVSGTEADLRSFDDTRSGAAIYAEDDFIIDGGGNLTVKGYLNNGITCKDDFRQDGGFVSVEAANNGVRASESIKITGGTLTVRSGNDGLKTSSADKEGKGFIELSGGDVNVECGGDGISAVTTLTLSGGDVTVGIREDVIGDQSRKGLKAGELIDISGSTVHITVDDDGIRCGGNVIQSGGYVTIVAATGIQAGEKDSGVGDVKFTGGSIFICAVKQAVKAEGGFFADNELVAFCGSEKQAQPREGGNAWILASVEGSAGDEVIFGPGVKSYTAALHFRTILYTSSDLEPGENYLLACGSRNYTMTAH